MKLKKEDQAKALQLKCKDSAPLWLGKLEDHSWDNKKVEGFYP